MKIRVVTTTVKVRRDEEEWNFLTSLQILKIELQLWNGKPVVFQTLGDGTMKALAEITHIEDSHVWAAIENSENQAQSLVRAVKQGLIKGSDIKIVGSAELKIRL